MKIGLQFVIQISSEQAGLHHNRNPHILKLQAVEMERWGQGIALPPSKTVGSR